MSLFKTNLSPTFKYAGIVSGAGAIMDLNLITKQNALPTLYFLNKVLKEKKSGNTFD